MVADKKLLTSLQSIPTKQVVIGDGSRLECKQQGDMQLGKLLLHGVLVVPGLDRNCNSCILGKGKRLCTFNSD